MVDPVDEYLKKPVRYNSIDGLGEIGIGIMLLGMVLFHWLHGMTPAGTIWNWKYTPLIALLGLILAIGWGTKLLKQRITYRRTGFVKYRASALGTSVVGFIAGMMIMAVAACFLKDYLTGHLVALLAGASMAALYAYATRMERFWRWMIGVVMAFGPGAISMLPLNRQSLDTLETGVIGLCFLLSGIITFWVYLRSTPAPVDVQ